MRPIGGPTAGLGLLTMISGSAGCRLTMRSGGRGVLGNQCCGGGRPSGLPGHANGGRRRRKQENAVADNDCRLSADYRAPAVRVGQWLYCTRRNELCVVTNFTNGPARWPVGRPEGGGAGGPSMIVCHDLLVAALREDTAA